MQTINQKQIVSISLAILVFLSGCNTAAIQKTIKENTAAVGAATGAVVCGLVADKNKVAKAGACAVIGGLIGHAVGKHLDEQEKQHMAKATEQAIVTGEPQQWENPETGKIGQVKVIETVQEPGPPVTIPVLKGRIQKMPPLEYSNETYKTKKACNVRGGPGTDYVIFDSLAKNKNTHVFGKVIGKNWYVVGPSWAAAGFVHGNLLEALPNEAVTQEEAVHADEDIEKQTTTVAKTCRTTEQTIILKDGTKYQEKIKACDGPDGWEVV